MPTGYQIKNQYAAPGLPQVMEYQHYYPFDMQLEAPAGPRLLDATNQPLNYP